MKSYFDKKLGAKSEDPPYFWPFFREIYFDADVGKYLQEYFFCGGGVG